MRNRATFADDEEGAVAIEFAVLAVPFFLVLVAILEIAVLLTASMQFEHAVDRVTRRVMTAEVANKEPAIRNSLCGELVFPVDCTRIRIDYREIADVGAFDLPDPVASGAVNAAAFTFSTTSNPSFFSLRVGYEWPIVMQPFVFFLANLNNDSHFIVGTALARVER